jgi:CubicO group peptidase (beta-lactamase class C family)
MRSGQPFSLTLNVVGLHERSIVTEAVMIVVLTILCALVARDCIGADAAWPLPEWPTAEPADVGMDEAQLRRARDYALTGGGSGYITRHGRLVMSWGDPRARYDLKSTTKSIGVSSLGLAIADGKIRLEDKVTKHHSAFGVPPDSNRKTNWIQEVTILHLATQTAGFEKPGGYTKLIFQPGTKWSYSDGGPNWLAECVTLAYGQDVDELMFQRMFTPLGIDRKDLVWRRNAYRDAKIDGVMRREFGSGISANVDAMARIGYLYLRGGKWKETQILPRDFVEAAGQTIESVVGLPEVDPKRYGNASDHYGLLWWNNVDGTLKSVPRDAFWSWGLYDSLIVVMPSLDIVVARAGKSWQRKWDGHYDVLEPFLKPIVQSVRKDSSRAQADRSRAQVVRLLPGIHSEEPRATSLVSASDRRSPYPPSRAIRGIRWAPASTIIRRAKGSDNWPITWGNDGHLYTAYGDGRGFEPFVEEKLSMGLARVTGGPQDFRGTNIRSTSAERKGGGPSGPKVSGMLMVDGVLYMLVRNTGNSQLAWSHDHGRTWKWSQWKFETSFGYPTFLNFGRDYEGSREECVYVYSHDSASAYERADRMVLARVRQGQIKERGAYEFFHTLDADGAPTWTRHIDERRAVFADKGRCYRSSVSYNAPLGRYLWCQTGVGDDTRFKGGFAIYDAPEPWGPWTTVFFTQQWDVGPGETCSLPTKWMSADGRTVHLVFSGDDSFSVRKAALILADTSRSSSGLRRKEYEDLGTNFLASHLLALSLGPEKRQEN